MILFLKRFSMLNILNCAVQCQWTTHTHTHTHTHLYLLFNCGLCYQGITLYDSAVVVAYFEQNLTLVISELTGSQPKRLVWFSCPWWFPHLPEVDFVCILHNILSFLTWWLRYQSLSISFHWPQECSSCISFTICALLPVSCIVCTFHATIFICLGFTKNSIRAETSNKLSSLLFIQGVAALALSLSLKFWRFLKTLLLFWSKSILYVLFHTVAHTVLTGTIGNSLKNFDHILQEAQVCSSCAFHK